MPHLASSHGDTPRIQVQVSDLPAEKDIDFRDTSFFSQEAGQSLPSPDQVRSQARILHNYKSPGPSPPVHFQSLGLTVKFGTGVTMAEGQCIWAIGRFLQSRVPVPEIYGWRHDAGEVFLYMQHVRGVTLQDCWEGLDDEARNGISEQLREIVKSLRLLEQGSEERFIGSICRGPIQDIIVEPFPRRVHPTIENFHDWFTALANRHHPNLAEFVDPMRHGLPDDTEINFTHGDLHRSNIIVSHIDGEETKGKPPQVLAIVDWHQSGWYPAYWEYCKAVYTVDPSSEWTREYICRFLEPPECLDHWVYYMDAIGC